MSLPVKFKKYRKYNCVWAARLRDLRRDRDITQDKASAMLGVSPRTWIAWENYQRCPSGPSIRLLETTFPELKRYREVDGRTDEEDEDQKPEKVGEKS